MGGSGDYDALLVVSFGGPEGPGDVLPFLENVLRGRPVSSERKMEVARHYQMFGGVSPINQQNRDLIQALRDLLARRGPDLPVYLGNRNWHPLLTDTVGRMAADGVRRALAFFTSAYSSYSSCRQYLEDIQRARAAVGETAPVIDKLRVYYNHPGFIGPCVESLCAALERHPRPRRDALVLFTAHSIPVEMARACRYESQLLEVGRLIAEAAGVNRWRVVYQSRSGSPEQPWLEPDVCDFLKEVRKEGVTDVVLAPVGFISDHLEVCYDLDIEAAEVCEALGIHMVRAATIGTHPRFVEMIRDLILERITDRPLRLHLGRYGPDSDCGSDKCCLRR